MIPPVGGGQHGFEYAGDEHQPAEEHRQSQVALHGIEEDGYAGDDQNGADEQQQPPVADGAFRIFEQ